MPYLNPKWFKDLEKDINRICNDLHKCGVAYAKPNNNLSRFFSMKCKDLLNPNDFFIDVATTSYRKKQNKTIFVLAPNVKVMPIKSDMGIRYHFKRLRL